MTDSTLIARTQAIEEDGHTVLGGVYSPDAVRSLLESLSRAMASNAASDGASLRARDGDVYAARNVLSWWNDARDVWRVPALVELLLHVLGPDAGLVRGLYFDKPPERSWSLPWHKDLTIAVRDNTRGSDRFTHPTFKAGVPHVEAPQELLLDMLTLRIFLDDVTEDNGPLRVLPGSHRDKTPSREMEGAVLVLGRAGDVLAMRPLLAHASGHSSAGTVRHRRTLHLEFAARPILDDGFEWHEFLPVHG